MRRGAGKASAAFWPLLLWLGAACVSHATREKAGDRPAAASIPIEIENHNWSDVVIYVLRGSQPNRLGMVTGLGNATFSFPSRYLASSSNVRLTAYPIGGPRAFTSEPILVQPGQMIRWTLESDLSRSSLSVY